MTSFTALLVVLFVINSCVPSHNLPLVKQIITPSHYSIQVLNDNLTCFYHDKLINCYDVPYILISSDLNSDRQFFLPLFKSTQSVIPKVRIPRPTFSLKGRLDRPDKFYTTPQTITQPYIINRNVKKRNNNLIPFNHKNRYNDTTVIIPTVKNTIKYSKNNLILNDNDTVGRRTTSKSFSNAKFTTNFLENNIYDDFYFEQFKKSLERFDSIFYQASFTKLRALSPEHRNENAISFVQSGLLLYIALMAISTEVDLTTKLEIDSCLMYPSTVMEKIKVLKHVIDWLPVANNNLKFRWASHLALEDGLHVSQGFVGGIANYSKLYVEQFNSTDTKENLYYKLNDMVERESGPAMADTFLEDDFSEGFCSVFVTTLYIRARWRVAPTVLNNTYPFKDGNGPERSVRMIKLNDMMGYVELNECSAVVTRLGNLVSHSHIHAIEIKYASPGLTLLMVIPRGNYIRNLIDYMKTTTPQEISDRMHTVRVAATLPIYTLRMTLLLQGKLQLMNISRLMDAKMGNNNKCGELRISHAMQRLMFWAEAGRNAFKDDGIEWDETPDIKLIADRPYIFFVRWKNVTLMNGNFVL